MKLLLITDLYPSGPEDVTGTLALHYYVRQWVRDGHQVDVVNIHSPNALEWRAHRRRKLPSSFTLDQVKVSNRMMLRLPGEVSIYPQFSKKDITQFDAIIGHLPRGARLAYLLSCKFHNPFIMGIHYTDFKRSKLRHGQVTKAYLQMLTRASFIHFRSAFLKEQFEKATPSIASRSAMMPGGVNESWLEAGPVRAFSTMQSPKLLTVSQLIKRKNIDLVINACKSINLPGLTYRVVGVGEELPVLESLAEGLRVDFVGALGNEEVRNEMDHCDIFILTSKEETFGLVYLEAMARGCITIGTIGEGIAGVIQHGVNGFLSEPDEQSIVRVLKQVMSLAPAELRAVSEAAIATSTRYSYRILARDFISRVEAATSLN